MASHLRKTMSPTELQSYCNNLSEKNNIMASKGSPSESNFVSSGWSPYSSWSNFSSPFGSEMGSTETESEDSDVITELSQLTRHMAEYTFQDDNELFKKAAPAGEDDDFITELSELTRHIAKYTFQDEDELFKAILAGCTASEKTDKASGLSAEWSQGNSSSVYYSDKGVMSTSENSNNSESGLAKSMNSELCSDQVLTEEQMIPLQVYELKNQPEIRKQGLEHGGGTRKRVKGSEHSKGPQNMQLNKEGKAWRNGERKRMNPPPPPPVSPQVGSGVRAVYLAGSNSRTGSRGTGVFLPSATSSYGTAEPKRKSGCSTVLIPARVLQTLQQHFNDVVAQSQSTSTGGSPTPPWQNDILARINRLLSQQKEHVEFQTRSAKAYHNEQEEEKEEEEEEEAVELPQEWTY